MFKLTPDGFSSDLGNVVGYLELSAEAGDPDWQKKQLSSMGEYLEHVQEIPPETRTLYHLFDGFIAAALSGLNKLRIIDVGCGIQPDWPVYVSSLRRAQPASGNLYVGLDPINYALDKRSYPFICGRLEDLPGILDAKFDVFIFATSLDHFEDIEKLSVVVKSLSSKQAICIFWAGLHDSVIVAEQAGVRVFSKLFQSLNPLRFCPRLLVAVARLLKYYASLLVRRSSLLKGESLDNLHYYYFTQQDIFSHLNHFGQVQHTLRVPGTNSMFAVVKVRFGGDGC